jgi:hypothetical protein
VPEALRRAEAIAVRAVDEPISVIIDAVAALLATLAHRIRARREQHRQQDPFHRAVSTPEGPRLRTEKQPRNPWKSLAK